MTKSISPETKSSPMFAYAKINNLNNREATRFAELFVDTLDFETLCKSPKGQLKLSSYRAFCREPNINKDQYSGAVTGDTTVGDLQTQSRSKLVMAYEKQRKAYLKIKELRAIKPTEVDEIMSNSNPYELSIPAGLTYRTAVLQEILRYISTTK